MMKIEEKKKKWRKKDEAKMSKVKMKLESERKMPEVDDQCVRSGKLSGEDNGRRDWVIKTGLKKSDGYIRAWLRPKVESESTRLETLQPPGEDSKGLEPALV